MSIRQNSIVFKNVGSVVRSSGSYVDVWGFPGGSVVKNPPAMWETWV